MNPFTPDLSNYPDFVRLLRNAGYEASLSFEKYLSMPTLTVPVLTIDTVLVQGMPAMMTNPQAFKKWLDDIESQLGLYKGFSLDHSTLRTWGFQPRNEGVWSKQNSTSGDVLFINPQGVYGGQLLYVINQFGDEIISEEVKGPVSSTTHLERMLREKGWLGVSSESL